MVKICLGYLPNHLQACGRESRRELDVRGAWHAHILLTKPQQIPKKYFTSLSP